jgi:hypothetical protein
MLTRSLTERRGLAAVELGLFAPVLLVLMLAGYDLTLWIRSAFRLDETAANIGETISQCNAINDPADINAFDANAQIMAGSTNISSPTGGAFIISAVGYNTSGKLVVLWQRRMGNPIYGSHIGASGGAAALGAYSLPIGEVLIATEAFSGVQPWTLSKKLMPKLALPPLYSSALFVSRAINAGAVATLNETNSGTLACAS